MRKSNEIETKIEYLKSELNRLIEDKSYCMTNPQVYEMSKSLDDLIYLYYINPDWEAV